ncbi:hypothetical protein [Sporosarcina sp. HYO08]|uniref:hypothetical protein n=1 Tax=Sporosarcina sp. HYO08 TaxID=1759557 RepID=UPI000791A3C6|nr:hypothetical protein [Sporosarcina sp. HYO08]KXH81885.1 hypothetical protein AU377_06375 [Sporosarcina sp. HYO08]
MMSLETPVKEIIMFIPDIEAAKQHRQKMQEEVQRYHMERSNRKKGNRRSLLTLFKKNKKHVWQSISKQ